MQGGAYDGLSACWYYSLLLDVAGEYNEFDVLCYGWMHAHNGWFMVQNSLYPVSA
jgi:hypothetical protein